MADNTTLPGTGEVYAASEKTFGGVLAKHQRVDINFYDGPSCDAFGRIRTSDPETIFDSKLLHADDQSLLWDEELISGTMATAAPTAAKPFIDFTSTNVTAGRRVRQTFQRFNYQPGHSQLILMTGVLELASGTKTGCERRFGQYDDDNGVFFESDAGTIAFTIRTNDTGSPVDTTVAQASWSLDTLDGGADASNPSGLTLDATKAQIVVFDYQWLSVGRVRVGFQIGGITHYVHAFNVSNTLQIPWTSTPNLPLRYEIVTTTSSGVCSMRCICGSVISEGGVSDRGIVRYRSTSGAAVTSAVENTLYVLVAVRLKTTHLGGSVRPISANIFIESANEKVEWVLLHGDKNNPLTIGGSLTYADFAESICQTALGATANTVSGGVEIDGGYSFSGSGGGGAGVAAGDTHSTLPLGAAIDGTRSELVLAFRPIGGVSAADVEGSLKWREIT